MQVKIKDVTHKFNKCELDKFEFNWALKTSDESVTYAAIVKETIAGLVEFSALSSGRCNHMHLIEVIEDYRGTSVAGKLLAFVGKDSIDRGYDGFVVFESKTVIYEYYIEKYGAKPISGKKLYFDTEATEALIKKYLEVNCELDRESNKVFMVREEQTNVYKALPSLCDHCRKDMTVMEDYVKKYGYGIIPNSYARDFVGFREKIAIEQRLGRAIRDAEWESMSIR